MHHMRFFFLLLAYLFAQHAYGEQIPSSKGMAEIIYEKKLTPEIRQEAAQKAKINAMDRYFAETAIGKQKNYETMREQIIQNIDSYIISTEAISSINNKSSKKYTAVIRADINVLKLDNILLNSSAVSNTNSNEKSMMTFVFVAREQTSIQNFDAKVYKRSDTSAELSQSAQGESNAERTGFEGEKISGSSIQTTDKVDSKINQNINAKSATTLQSTTGGSTTRKADKVEWNVSSTQEINAVLTNIFSTAGFDVYEAEMLELETQGLLQTALFKQDYSHGDDLTPQTLSNAAKGIRGLGGKYFAIGTLDIGLNDVDPVTGLQRVYVTITGKMVDVSGRFPRTVASVGPVQISGVGPNGSVAKTNALQLAAESAGGQLVDLLNAKSVY